MMNCQKCGEKLETGEKYCSNCGASTEVLLSETTSNVVVRKEIQFYIIFYIIALVSLFYTVGAFYNIGGSAIRSTVAQIALLNTSLLFVSARIIQVLESMRKKMK